MNGKNPHEICTLDENSDCSLCELNKQLHCKFKRKHSLIFAGLAVPYMAVGFVGLFFTGFYTGNFLFLIAYAIFAVLFFTVIEARLLCRHCPYYAKEGRQIHCYANEGLPKLWKYQPKPLTRTEKGGFIACIIFFGSFPILADLYGILILFLFPRFPSSDPFYTLRGMLFLIGITITTAVLIVAWLTTLQLYFCPNCVNFSCPLNRVPKVKGDQYLDRNQVIKEAWEKAGYSLG